MKKYVVMETKGNMNKTVQVFETKEDALAFGNEYIKSMPRENGILSCSYTDVDAHGNMTSNSEQIYHVWA